MRDTAIFEILNKVRREEALANAALAVDDEVDLFGHKLRGRSEVARIGNARASHA
jgi:hypothetical protein